MYRISFTRLSPMPPKSSASTRAKWDGTSEDILIEGVKGAVASGVKADKNFKPQVYQAISGNLNQAEYDFDAQQVKSRWNRFKASWKTVNYLRNLSAFGWDDEKKCVTATEDVWRNLLYNEDGSKKKKFDDYNYFKTHNFPYYNDINALVGDSAAQGDQVFSSTAGASTSTSTDPEANAGAGVDAGNNNNNPTDANQPEADDSGPAGDVDALPPYTLTISAAAYCWQQAQQHPPVTPVKKRVRPSSGAQIGQLVDCVDKLVSGLVSLTKGFTPRTRKSRKDLAWSTIKKEEGLSPRSLAKARRVLNGGDDVVEDFLSFDAKDEDERMARSFWLADEMDNLA
ncbi:hypothetical protein D9758_013232 [Tetrapyrgos nigripes]|uniref:Myb/SANT-like domain-containing protein n=1 Tax=Tetrapyrgos nigripes TaxID=182062 RepID=A0A8H5CRT5_9AGAR|nr:hypothetical protein D9758_013232 [Tetrapyrgos nigripes]